MHKTCYVFFSMVCARLIIFYFYFFSPRRSRRGTLGISSPGGPVEEPLKPFCLFFSLRRLSSSVVFQWGSLRQTLDLSKTTNEKVPWRRPSNDRIVRVVPTFTVFSLLLMDLNSSHASLQGFSLSEFLLGGFKFCALLLQPRAQDGFDC